MGQRVGGSQNRLVGQQGSDAGVTGDTVPLIVQALARPGAAGNFGTGTRAVGLAQRPEILSSTTQRAVGGILGLPSSPSNEFPRFPLMAAAQTKGPIPGDLGQLQRMEAEGLDAARNRRIAPPATPDRLEGVIEAKDAASRAIAAILDPIAGGADAML